MTSDELKPMIYFQTKSDFGGIFKLVLLSGSLCETKWNLLQINGIIFFSTFKAACYCHIEWLSNKQPGMPVLIVFKKKRLLTLGFYAICK